MDVNAQAWRQNIKKNLDHGPSWWTRKDGKRRKSILDTHVLSTRSALNDHCSEQISRSGEQRNSHGPCWSAWRRRSKQRTRMVWRLGNCSHQAGANFIYPQTKLSRRLCFFKHPTSCMTKNRIRMSTSRMFGDWSVISKKSNFWCHGQDIRPRKKRHGDFAN